MRSSSPVILFTHHSYSGPPWGLLIFGVFSLFLAVNGACTGEAWAGFGRVVYRAKEPKQFRGLIVMYCLGACFIGFFLYKLYEFPN
jgi:hypothetical protein